MHLIFVILLGVFMPSTPEGASPAPTPAKATGELTNGERLFQGVWDYSGSESAFGPGTLRIDGRDFDADVIHGQYTGYVSIRSDTDPAQIDFTIQGCECKFNGMTSRGIYYEDDGTIVFATRAPGEPRPQTFSGLEKARHEIVRLRRQDPATDGS